MPSLCRPETAISLSAITRACGTGRVHRTSTRMDANADEAAGGNEPLRMFPATRQTWLQGRLRGGADHERAEVLHELMAVYYTPLLAYVRASRLAAIGDPEDLVHGYFSDRLAAGTVLAAWNPEHLPLRRYLVNGLWFHARDRMRRQHRQSKAQNNGASCDELDLVPSDEPGPWRALCSAFARTLVHVAMDHAAGACQEADLDVHWQVFVRQRYRGETYASIAIDLGETPGRVAVMARTAGRRFDAALRELLVRDGVPRSRLDAAIQELLGDDGS